MNTLIDSRQPDRVLDSITQCFTPEVATRMLAVRFDDQLQSRADELASRAAEGRLTADERQEYEDLIEKTDLVGVLKALARRALVTRPT